MRSSFQAELGEPDPGIDLVQSRILRPDRDNVSLLRFVLQPLSVANRVGDPSTVAFENTLVY